MISDCEPTRPETSSAIVCVKSGSISAGGEPLQVSRTMLALGDAESIMRSACLYDGVWGLSDYTASAPKLHRAGAREACSRKCTPNG